MKASILVLSGGLDSAVSAYLARKNSTPRLALFFDYGQRAVDSEQKAAGELATRLNVPLEIVSLPWLTPLGQSALTDTKQSLPRLSADQLDELNATTKSARAVWIPNRNGIFLNVAAAYAESLEADFVVTGFNAEEAASFPDNGKAFVSAAIDFFRHATLTGVQVISYTQDWDKATIVQKGLEMDVPFDHIWSCYEAGSKQCGRCESCLRSIRAYQKVGIWERMKDSFIQ